MHCPEGMVQDVERFGDLVGVGGQRRRNAENIAVQPTFPHQQPTGAGFLE
jgi:hypothetical protein